MANSYVFRPKDQIAYIPHHADGKMDHPDTEFGFVTSVSEDGEIVFCRYWRDIREFELRTKANSEATPYDLLVHHKSVPDEVIDEAWRIYVIGFSLSDPRPALPRR